jgi:hypothetical protein
VEGYGSQKKRVSERSHKFDYCNQDLFSVEKEEEVGSVKDEGFRGYDGEYASAFFREKEMCQQDKADDMVGQP